MKAKNLNNSSFKTRTLIKNVFAEMLSEKKELSNISVKELCERADISRGTFYSHYDDIYGVAEDYENELISHFFDNATLLNSNSIYAFIEVFFSFINDNNYNYRLLCKSNDFIFSTRRLTNLAINKILEICNNDPLIKNKTHMNVEITIFIEGLICEYVKYCRDYTTITLEELYLYTKDWIKSFQQKRF